MSDKIRLDVALVERGFATSREKARALIMTGNVLVNNEKCDKCGLNIACDSDIIIKGNTLKYVSRGGLKLEKAINEYALDLTDCVCMDIGASTGGFSDCMLQNGAKKIYAVDVGYGQLAWSLRTDARVVNLERTNIRYITKEQVPQKIDFASIDVSFISLTLVLPVLYNFLNDNGRALCLVKPQFEAGKGKVGKKGVVKEISTHIEVCKKILDFCNEIGFSVTNVTFSPIKGPQGNIEYLFFIKKCYDNSVVTDDILIQMIENSHNELSEKII